MHISVLPVIAKSEPCTDIPSAFQANALFFVGQSDRLIGARFCRRAIFAVQASHGRDAECKHQAGSLSDLTRALSAWYASAA